MAGRGRRSSGRAGGGSRGSTRSAARGGHKYPRSARVGETLREIIAEELVRIDDERLTFVTVTGIEVDDELNRAHVFFDSLEGEDGDEQIVEALTHHRIRLQAAIAKQIRAKKTPILDFRPDLALRGAQRIDDILRADREIRGPLPDDYGIADDIDELDEDQAPDAESDAESDVESLDD
jgi:ribosome-binding factor A